MGIFSNQSPEEKAEKLAKRMHKRLYTKNTYRDGGVYLKYCLDDSDVKKLFKCDGGRSLYTKFPSTEGGSSSILEKFLDNISRYMSRYEHEHIDRASSLLHSTEHFLNVQPTPDKNHFISTFWKICVAIKKERSDNTFRDSSLRSLGLLMGSVEDLGFTTDSQGNTLLMSMLKEYPVPKDILEKALKKTPDLNHQNTSGDTALLLAIAQQKSDFFKKILEVNPDINKANNQGETALLLALKNNDEDLAYELLEKGSDPRAVSDEGDVFYFARTEKMRQTLKEKINTLTPPSVNPDMITLTTKVSDILTLTEIFNFKKMECHSFIQKDGEPPGAPSRETFEALENSPSLQEAFAKHRQMGGTTDPNILFPKRKVALPATTTP